MGEDARTDLYLGNIERRWRDGVYMDPGLARVEVLELVAEIRRLRALAAADAVSDPPDDPDGLIRRLVALEPAAASPEWRKEMIRKMRDDARARDVPVSPDLPTDWLDAFVVKINHTTPEDVHSLLELAKRQRDQLRARDVPVSPDDPPPTLEPSDEEVAAAITAFNHRGDSFGDSFRAALCAAAEVRRARDVPVSPDALKEAEGHLVALVTAQITLVADNDAKAFGLMRDKAVEFLNRPRDVPVSEYPDLFVQGNYTLHSGDKSGWKIECDALSDAEIGTLALMLSERLPAFGSVYGVPTGGTRIAAAMAKYATTGPRLIVDDVLTTGASMDATRSLHSGPTIGAVLFARGPCPSWVTPLFSAVPVSEYTQIGWGSEGVLVSMSEAHLYRVDETWVPVWVRKEDTVTARDLVFDRVLAELQDVYGYDNASPYEDEAYRIGVSLPDGAFVDVYVKEGAT